MHCKMIPTLQGMHILQPKIIILIEILLLILTYGILIPKIIDLQKSLAGNDRTILYVFT